MVNKARFSRTYRTITPREENRRNSLYLNDESGPWWYAVVIEVRRDVSASVVLNNLYKLTPLQSNFDSICLRL